MEDSNIIIKITSEADLTQAQKQMANLTKQADQLEEQIKQTIKAEKEDAKSIKSLNLAQEEESKRLAENARFWKQEREYLRNDIKERKQSIKSLQDQVKSYKTLNGMSGKAVQQLRAMREELLRMEDAGEFGTEAFMKLSVAAGKLEDKIGDTQKRIHVLSSDTRVLDTLAGAGEVVSSSFNMMTSAAEVLGEDMEGLQRAFYKVQASLSILNSVQSLANMLNKDSTLIINLNSAATAVWNWVKGLSAKTIREDVKETKKDIVAKGVLATVTAGATGVVKLLTGAVKALGKAIKANPIGMLVGGAVAVVGAVKGVFSGLLNLFRRENEHAVKYREHMNAYKRLSRESEAQMSRDAFNRQVRLNNINEKEEDNLRKAKKRHASELEMAKIEKKAADERYGSIERTYNREWNALQRQLDQLKKARDEKEKHMLSLSKGTQEYIDASKAYNEANELFQNVLGQQNQLFAERNDAIQAQADAEMKIEEVKTEMLLEAERMRIELMQEGATKEIASINLEYREKLKTLQGNSEEEIKLRKALEAKQAREIQAVRDKYAQQARESAISNKRNLLGLMSITQGTEEDYQEQLKLQKKILALEAANEVKALEASVKRKEMSAEDARIKISAINLQLTKDINEINENEIKRKEEIAKKTTEIFIKEAENEANALKGNEPIEEQLNAWNNYYKKRKVQIAQNYEFDLDEATRMLNSGQVTREQYDMIIRDLDAKLQSDLTELAKEGAEKRIEVEHQYLTDLEIAVSKAEDKLGRAQTTGDRLNALREQRDAQLALYDEQQRELEAKWDAGLISFSEYKQQEWEITKATTDAEVQYQTEAMNAIADGFQTALDYMQQLSDLAFEAINQNIQAEMDALDKEYTTDWEEAQKNADKKYITEKEYEKKKAALEEKQAKYAKAQALTNIAIQTAQAIITTLAQLGATPWGIAASVLAGSMGAAQLAVAASKPLAQYEKGRKGGKGEYAIVGEKGAEIMYVPDGASIIPNNKIDKPAEWAKFGVPELPHSDPEVLRYVVENSGIGLDIDYDRIGASVAKHLPKQRNVTVNVDRSGVSVNDGSQHTYLNAKYNGSWN